MLSYDLRYGCTMANGRTVCKAGDNVSVSNVFACEGEENVRLQKEIECNFKQFTFKDEHNYLAEDILSKCEITAGRLYAKD